MEGRFWDLQNKSTVSPKCKWCWCATESRSPESVAVEKEVDVDCMTRACRESRLPSQRADHVGGHHQVLLLLRALLSSLVPLTY